MKSNNELLNELIGDNEPKKSNSLVYKCNKVKGKKHLYVTIQLDDECKNGHQDFAITGDLYEAGKPKTDRYYISGGCIHEEIEKFYPEFVPFIRLHLADYKGIPMYASENGFYHMNQGFNRTKPEDSNFQSEFCEYYRITPEQFNELKKAKNGTQYGMALYSLGIAEQWKKEANEAIKLLEQLTGISFLVDSVKDQMGLTDEKIKEENKKQAEGYYLPEAIAAREKAAMDKIIAKLKEERDNEIKKQELEYTVKMEVLAKGGTKALDNVIFYNHTQTLSFNWRSYDNLPTDYINDLIGKLQLPEGVKAEISKNK